MYSRFINLDSVKITKQGSIVKADIMMSSDKLKQFHGSTILDLRTFNLVQFRRS